MTEKEFSEIVNSTKKIVLAAIGKNLAARFFHAIDDVAQETYIRAYKSLMKNKFSGDSSIETWLYKIAKNESLRMNEKLFREEKKIKKSIEKIEMFVQETGNEFNTDLRDLSDSISRLPEKYMSVMKLIFDGCSVKQISETLNIKPGTVKSRTSRGRDMLYKLLQGGYNE